MAGNLEPHHARLFSASTVSWMDFEVFLIDLLKPSLQLPVEALLQAGFGREPFVRTIIRIASSQALFQLKWKARIFVKDGVHLLGG